MPANPINHTTPRHQQDHSGFAPAALAQLCAVHKHFGERAALTGVNLAIQPGEVVALLGPNGAGKTTALSILLGLRRPDRGQAWLFGRPPQLPLARRQIGATPQDTGFPPALTVSEVVALVRTHYPQPLATTVILERFGLQDLAHRQTAGLSGGQKRRLAVTLAFAGNPKAVFLDEPTTGLDVEARRGLWTAIRHYVQGGGTILLTTHYLDEAEALATRVVIIDHGQIMTEGSVDTIRAQVRLTRVRFRAPSLPELPGVVQVEQDTQGYLLYTHDADALVRALCQQDVPFAGLEVRSVTLEEAFLRLTGGDV